MNSDYLLVETKQSSQYPAGQLNMQKSEICPQMCVQISVFNMKTIQSNNAGCSQVEMEQFFMEMSLKVKNCL